MSAPDTAPQLSHWRLIAEAPPERTATGIVQMVRRGDERLVLKIVTHQDEASQPEALAHFAGRGAVRLVGRDPPAMLLERAWPGTPLSSLVTGGRDEEATAIVAEVIERLHCGPAPAGFRTVEDLGLGFDRVRNQALAAGAAAALLDRAQRLYDELCASQGQRVLLHGDLHHDNILEDDQRGWLAIDPKGVVGEGAYETGAMLRNPGPDAALYADPRIIRRRCDQLAERLGYDPQRIIGWCFAQSVLSALWRVEDDLDPTLAWRMAQASRPVL